MLRSRSPIRLIDSTTHITIESVLKAITAAITQRQKVHSITEDKLVSTNLKKI